MKIHFLSVFFLILTSGLHVHAQGMSSVAGPSKYDRVKQYLQQIETDFPTIAHKIAIGPSDSGETIWGLAIGNGPLHNLLVATHHGNEYGSTEVGLSFARFAAQHPIAGQTIFVIPVLNIEGYNADDRYESANGESYDPNRDYPGPCGTEGPHHLKSTADLAKFIDEQNIVSSATLHTFFPAVVYPWGFATHDLATAYETEFKEMVRLATVESAYQTGNSSEVIYPAAGCYEDYAFWKHGIWSLLFELGYSHSPNNTQVEELIRVNVPGLYRFFQTSPTARATDHAFTGSCDERLLILDRHDE